MEEYYTGLLRHLDGLCRQVSDESQTVAKLSSENKWLAAELEMLDRGKGAPSTTSTSAL